MFSYHNKKFQPVQNTENGETSAETIFHYKQEGNILTSEYAGGKIVKGHLTVSYTHLDVYKRQVQALHMS